MSFSFFFWTSVLFFFFLLYNIVLVLPYINMNLPRVYTCSQSWTSLPPPSPYHPSGSSQCTSPKHPVFCVSVARTLLHSEAYWYCNFFPENVSKRKPQAISNLRFSCSSFSISRDNLCNSRATFASMAFGWHCRSFWPFKTASQTSADTWKRKQKEWFQKVSSSL